MSFDGKNVVMPVTIANGASLSGVVGLIDYNLTLVGIQMPAAWTAAALTFQVSVDGGSTWQNLYDGSSERSEAVDAARYQRIDYTKYAGFTWLKVRSGTAGTPVNQGAARILYLQFAKVLAG